MNIFKIYPKTIILFLAIITLFFSGLVQAYSEELEEFKFAWPVVGEIITKYDLKGDYEAGSHRGIDIKAEPGTTVAAPANGLVAHVAKNTLPGFGGGMILTIDHDNDLSTTYLGIEDVVVKKGDLVQKGEKLAIVFSSGDAKSSPLPHLHFGAYRTSQKKSANRYIDPGSLLSTIFIEENNDIKEEIDNVPETNFVSIPIPIEEIDVSLIKDIVPEPSIELLPEPDVESLLEQNILHELPESELLETEIAPENGIIPEPNAIPILELTVEPILNQETLKSLKSIPIIANKIQQSNKVLSKNELRSSEAKVRVSNFKSKQISKQISKNTQNHFLIKNKIATEAASIASNSELMVEKLARDKREIKVKKLYFQLYYCLLLLGLAGSVRSVKKAFNLGLEWYQWHFRQPGLLR